MSKTKGLNVKFVNPAIAAAAHETMEAVMQAAEKASIRETAGPESGETSDDRYWERRCHRAEEHLQEIARELERKDAIIQEHQCVITSLEMDNRMLSAQLEMVHLIFGRRG